MAAKGNIIAVSLFEIKKSNVMGHRVRDKVR
jgi:hypothetical protein